MATGTVKEMAARIAAAAVPARDRWATEGRDLVELFGLVVAREAVDGESHCDDVRSGLRAGIALMAEGIVEATVKALAAGLRDADARALAGEAADCPSDAAVLKILADWCEERSMPETGAQCRRLAGEGKQVVLLMMPEHVSPADAVGIGLAVERASSEMEAKGFGPVFVLLPRGLQAVPLGEWKAKVMAAG